MNLLISIKPQYVEKIISGEKIYEFRKKYIKPVEKVYIYETAPTKRITVICEIEEIIIDIKKNVWNKCKQFAGISKKDFMEYYKRKETAYAYKLKNIEKVNIELKEIVKNNIPPQSFYYINKEK